VESRFLKPGVFCANPENGGMKIPELALHIELARQSAIAEERNRIARELHDTVAQAMTAALMQMEIAEEGLQHDQQDVREHLQRARRLISQGLTEARESILRLRPEISERQGLGERLRQLAGELLSDSRIQPKFVFQNVHRMFDPEMESQVLRIAQEALTNVIKHAQASQVQIKFTAGGQWIRLSIWDDGAGFSRYASRAHQCFGLKFMKERAAQMGGRLVIHSQPGSGTSIHVTLPVAGKTVLEEDCA
jgi:signal transduction histidine kinase